MADALEKSLTDIVELTDVSRDSLDEAVDTVVKQATSKSRLIQDIEIDKCPDTSENQPILEPNLKIKFAIGEKRS